MAEGAAGRQLRDSVRKGEEVIDGPKGSSPEISAEASNKDSLPLQVRGLGAELL